MKKKTGFDRGTTRNWHPATQAVRGGTWRSEQGETSDEFVKWMSRGGLYNPAPDSPKEASSS